MGNTLERLGIKSKPSAIFNCDATGFSGKETYRGKVIVRRGTKHPYQQSVRFTGHTTVHVAASADGKVIPPLIISEKCLPRNILEDIPASWNICATKSGYITTDLFHVWFRDVFLAECGVERPLLLIMDNHISHLSPDIFSLAQENNVELFCLPPHNTHLLQPLDKGYFNLLKSQMAMTPLPWVMQVHVWFPGRNFQKIFSLPRLKYQIKSVSFFSRNWYLSV